MAKIAVANEVPKLFTPKNANVSNKGNSDLEPLSLKDQGKLNEELDPSGTDEWTQEQKDAVNKLFIDYGRLFALDSNDLGHKNLVKHGIKPFTVFTVGPLRFYECERMPFSLTNAPATFQRLMENCLGDLHLNWCIIYLDDIIVFCRTPEEHLEWLSGVFAKLAAAGLKLKPSKCEFFKNKITYLGHQVSEKGCEGWSQKGRSYL